MEDALEDVQSRTVLASPPGIPEELRKGSSSTSEGLDRAGQANGNPHGEQAVRDRRVKRQGTSCQTSTGALLELQGRVWVRL